MEIRWLCITDHFYIAIECKEHIYKQYNVSSSSWGGD